MFKSVKKFLIQLSCTGFILCLAALFLTTPALADSHRVFTSLAGLPGFDPNTQGIGDFFQALYTLAIIIGALLAVVRIVIAGVKYVLSASAPTTAAAREDIKGSLLGLLLIIGAVVILNTINPELANLDIFSRGRELQEERARVLQDVRDSTSEVCGSEGKPSCLARSCYDLDRTDTLERPNYERICPPPSRHNSISCTDSEQRCDELPAEVITTCAGWCEVAGGVVVGSSNGTNCYYPNDPDTEARIETATRNKETEARVRPWACWVEQESFVFLDFSTTEPPEYLKNIEGIGHLPIIQGIDASVAYEMVKGVLEIDENSDKAKKLHKIKEYRYSAASGYNEKITAGCVAIGGNRVISIHSNKYHYCVSTIPSVSEDDDCILGGLC